MIDTVKRAVALVVLVVGAGQAHAQGMGLLDVTYYTAPEVRAPAGSPAVQPGHVLIHGFSSLGREVAIDGYALYRSPQPIPAHGQHVETAVLVTPRVIGGEYRIDVRTDAFAVGHLVPLQEVRLVVVAPGGAAWFTVTTDPKHAQLRSFQRDLAGVRRLKIFPETQTAAPIWATGEMLDPGLFLMSTVSGTAYRIDLEMGARESERTLPPPPALGAVTRR